MITTNLIRKITLFPAARFNRFFFLKLHGKTLVYKNLNFKQVSYESGTLHNYCSDNLEPNSKDSSEYSVLCFLLRGSFFFFPALHGKALGGGAMKVVLCTIIVVITTNLIRMITLFPAARFNRFFFSGFPWEDVELYKNFEF